MIRLVACTAAVLVTAVADVSPADPAARWDGGTPKAGDIRFSAADGTRLVGHRFGKGTTAVVLVHQIRGSICQWAPYAKRLASLGYTAFALDLRGNGDSQHRAYPATQRYGGDVAAAVKTVRRLGAHEVFLVGASLGGSAAISAAANTRPAVDGVVSVSGAADLAGAIDAVTTWMSRRSSLRAPATPTSPTTRAGCTRLQPRRTRRSRCSPAPTSTAPSSLPPEAGPGR